ETRRVVAPLRRTDPLSAPEMVSGPPDVRISIGRVEVRAVLPTPDAPRVRRGGAPAEGRPLGECLGERGGQRRWRRRWASPRVAVSAVLRTVLNNGITEANLAAIVGGNITVSSLPPDRVPLSGAQDPNQLNLFLYHTSYNQGWRNELLPWRSVSGARTANPPL